MKNLSSLQRSLLAVAAVALVAGATFVLSSSGRKAPVLETVPRDVVEKNDQIIRGFSEQGGRRSGGILVSPTDILVRDVSVGNVLPVRIINRTLDRQRLRFDFLPVVRTLPGGAPSIETNPEVRAAGENLVSLSSDGVTLRPGQAFDLQARIEREPAGGVLVGSIGVTIKDPNPRTSDPSRGGVEVQIRNNVRVNTMVYATWPGADDQTVSLRRVRGTQPEESSELDFVVQVQGGPGIASPVGQVEIFNSAGRRVTGEKIENGQRVIPGAMRDLLLRAPIQALPPGDYEARATVLSGGSRQTVEWPFRIAEDGRLPTPAAQVALRINPLQAEPGSNVEVLASIRNNGTKNFQPRGQAKMFELGKNQVLAQEPLKTDVLAPGDIGEARMDFRAPDEPGNYEILVDIEAEDGSRLDQRVISFVVLADPPPPPGPVDRLRDWMSANPFGAAGVGIIVFALLALLLVGIVAISGRARRR